MKSYYIFTMLTTLTCSNYGFARLIVLFAGGWVLAQWRTASGLNKHVQVHGWPHTIAPMDIGDEGIVGTPGSQ